MKLFIVGSDKVYAIENFYAKYLRELEVEVSHFSAQSIFYDYYQKNIINKLIFKLGLSGVFKKINKQFKEQVEKFNPDIIWIFKGMEIFPRTLQWAKDRHIKLVNYNGDNPFIFSGKGSGNANVTKSIPLFNLHLTYNAQVKKEMEAVYKIPTAILPFGFDIGETLFENCRQQQEIIKACFLGNPDEFRGSFLEQLAQNGIVLDVYGNDWGKFVKHPNITIYNPVYGDDFWLTLRKYRVQLNLMRPHNPDTHNMRTFELPGVGGIQLAPKTDDHQNYFKKEKEIFLFEEVADCVAQINKILLLSNEQAEMIRNNARARSLQSGYRYKDRAYQALQQIKTILG
ncbi:MAG: glycosyltransferase [Ferruginibacter sp.]